MDRLNYHHLLYFFTVAQEGSVAKAGKRLGLAQPTVSAQIHALEQKLGRKLLERNGRGLKITPDGEMVMRYASSIFALGGELLSSLDNPARHGHPVAPLLNVGINPLLPQAFTGRLLTSLLALKPRLSLAIIEAEPEALSKKLLERTLHFAVHDSPFNGSGLHSRRILESPLALFASEPLARKLSKGFPSCLAGAPVLMTTADPLRIPVERWLDTRKLATRKLAEMPHPELCAREANAGIFAPLALRDCLHSRHGLKPVKQLDGAVWRLYVVTAGKGIKHPGIEAVIAVARKLR